MSERNVDMGHVIQASSGQALADNVSRFLIQRTRGAFWAEPVESNSDRLYLAARRSYFVPVMGGETQKVVTPLHRVLQKSYKTEGDTHTFVVPPLKELHEAFDRAEQLRDSSSYRAVIHTFSPCVAMVDSVGNQLGRFKLAYERYLQRGEALPHRGPIDTRYIQHMFGLEIIKGSAKDGYQLNERASRYIEHYRKIYADEGVKFDPGDPTPFLALCIQDPEYLSKEFRIGIPKSYFGLLHALFLQRLIVGSALKAQKPGITLRHLATILRRRGHGHLGEGELHTRIGNLIRTHAVEDIDSGHEWFTIRNSWFLRARDAFSDAQQAALAVA